MTPIEKAIDTRDYAGECEGAGSYAEASKLYTLAATFYREAGDNARADYCDGYAFSLAARL